jgi:1-acyl-sn-glycerol-3-phosphate acyltransferase
MDNFPSRLNPPTKWEIALYKTVQFFMRLLGRLMLSSLANIEIYGKENTKGLKGPLLILSNHKSYLDPLLIGCSLPLFSKIYPLRFIAKDPLFQKPISRIIFQAMGTFPTFYGSGLDKSLEMPSLVLKQNGTVVFFPEGRCVRGRELAPLKQGAATLIERFPNVPVLPVAIHNSYQLKRIPFFLMRPTVKICFGKAFYPNKDVIKGIESINDSVAKSISSYYSKIFDV